MLARRDAIHPRCTLIASVQGIRTRPKTVLVRGTAPLSIPTVSSGSANGAVMSELVAF